MKLEVGERLPGSGPPHQPGGYKITEVVSETPFYGLYVGKKILYNFDFTNKRIRETEEVEWLDVHLRTLRYPHLDDPTYVEQRRRLARAEAQFVLRQRQSNLWPEPIDLLEIVNTQDAFTFTQTAKELEPIVVFARPQGQKLADWQQQVLPVASIFSVLAELLAFLEQAHEENLLVPGLGTGSLLVDGAHRIHYLGTDLVLDASAPDAAKKQPRPNPTLFETKDWQRLFPRERWPRGYVAPEYIHGNTPDARSDLYAWGAIAYGLLTSQAPWRIAVEQGQLWARFQDKHFRRLDEAFRQIPISQGRAWAEQLGIDPDSMQWPEAALGVLRRVLDRNIEHRPKSVAELREWLVHPPQTETILETADEASRFDESGEIAVEGEAEPFENCPECSMPVRLGELETHLREAHHIYQFRGVRRSAEETRAAVLDALCGPNPDVAAWRWLESLALERDLTADPRLVSWLCLRLPLVPKEERGAAIASVAASLTSAGAAPRLLPILLRAFKTPTAKLLARQLALEVAGRVMPPVPMPIIDRLKPLLDDRHFPHDSRQRAVVGLLRTVGKDVPNASSVIEAYVAGTNKLKALDRLHDLEQQVGQLPALEQVTRQIEDQVRMTCPKCGIELRRYQMVDHVWEQHRLVLEGRRVREPWRQLADWVVDYGFEKDAELLRRCQDLAERADGPEGLLRLQRMLLRHGIDDPEARAKMQELAREKRASVCPHCFEMIPLPPEPGPLELRFGRGSLRGAGYQATVSERGLLPRLEVETPDQILFDGREPGRTVTRWGAVLAALALIVVAVLVFELVSGFAVPFPGAVAMAAGFWLIGGALTYFLWPAPRSEKDRLIDAFWMRLVPHVLSGTLQAQHVRLLAGLARESRGRGLSWLRRQTLDQAADRVERWARQDPTAYPPLGMLRALQAEDVVRDRRDAVPLLVDCVADCLRGQKPFTYAQSLLEAIELDWSRGDRARLQVLLWDRFWQSGLEVGDVQDLAQAYPALEEPLGLKAVDRLAYLQHLWSLRQAHPWTDVGSARTVFDMAADAALSRVLDEFPDLLLQVEGQPIVLGTVGVWCRHVCIREMPRRVEVVDLRSSGRGFEIVAGAQRIGFEDNPATVMEALPRWLRYYFGTFLPAVTPQEGVHSVEAWQTVAEPNAIECPACRRRSVPRLGDVGLFRG